MGREIVYCYKCQRRILGDELDKGSAYQVGHQFTCSTCAVHLLETLPPREKEKLLAKMFQETKDRQGGPSHGSRGTSPTPKRGSPAPEIKVIKVPVAVPGAGRSRSGPKWGLLAGLGVGVLATIIVVLALGGSSGTPVEETRPPAKPPGSSREDQRRQAAADAIRKARDFVQANASDCDRAVTLWQEAVFASDGTSYQADARREHQAAQARQRDMVAKELSDLEQRMSGFLGKEEYKAAQDALESARARHAAPEWALEISKRAAGVAEAMAKSLARMKEQASAAKQEGDAAAAAELRVKVAGWESPKLLSEFDQRLAAVTLPKPLVDAALVGYWPLNEGSGQTAGDVSGKGHTASLVATQWVPGKFGSGLRFNGSDSVMELSNSAALDRLQEGDYSLALWFMPEAIPPAGADNYGLIVKPGRHIGLVLGNEGRLYMGHWFAENGGTYQHAAIYRNLEAGAFLHLAAVVDWTRGATRIYVNGVQETNANWPKPKLPAFGYGNTPWRVGCAVPGAEQYRFAAKGVIDEVRLYARALSEAEVQVLFHARLAAK
jgi:hypothetical protein